MVINMEIEKKTIGFVVLLTALLGGTAGVIIDQDTPYFQCKSKELVSDCVNGIKACVNDTCTRCYYNESNNFQYEYCKEGWIDYSIEGLNIEPAKLVEYEICIRKEEQEACIAVS